MGGILSAIVADELRVMLWHNTRLMKQRPARPPVPALRQKMPVSDKCQCRIFRFRIGHAALPLPLHQPCLLHKISIAQDFTIRARRTGTMR